MFILEELVHHKFYIFKDWFTLLCFVLELKIAHMPSRHFSWVSCPQLGLFSVPLSSFSFNSVPYLTVLTSQLFCVSISLPLFSFHHNLATPHLWISLCILGTRSPWFHPNLNLPQNLHLWALTFWVAGVIGLDNQVWFYMAPFFFYRAAW